MIKEKGLKREGEKILGLDDYMNELRESQKDAFAPTDAPKVPTFTTPTNKGGGDGKTPVYTRQYGSHAIERLSIRGNR